MHRTLSITIQPEHTDALCRNLQNIDGVVGLTLQRGASLKPPGDALTVAALNRSVDDILKQVAAAQKAGPIAVVTSEVASLTVPQQQSDIENDTDEAIWEEMETGLRHQAKVTPNYLMLMALGGAVAGVGLVSEPGPQARYFVAAAIIAPGMESLAKIPLAFVIRKWQLLRRAVTSFACGYLAIVAAGALTYWLLEAVGQQPYNKFVDNAAVHKLAHPGTPEMLLSVCGALAGMVIYSTYRRSVVAGALIAVFLIEAATAVGMGIASQRWDLAGQALQRLGLECLFIIVVGLAVFMIKQTLSHQRQPLA